MRKVIFRRARLRRSSINKSPKRKAIIKGEELKKGIFIIPSLFTCANMSLGILSIFASVENNFIRAAWFLIAALACDIIDGRIARMTNTTSMFGMQLDSLSDLVSFGIAPAMMIFMLVLKDMGTAGTAIAVLFVLCSALRLARFNMFARSGEIFKHFTGLPTPASAGVIISFVLSSQLLASQEYSANFKTIPLLTKIIPLFSEIMPVVMVILSFLMVSNIPYLSLKRIKLTRARTIELLAVLIVLIILVVVYPQNTIFIIFSGYAISGLLFYIPRIVIERKKGQKHEKAVENEV
ncbi:MAG: CDP-diacylglycerol--serine O-phosphatidyltransferase [Treponema sp.]|jgi:CDP-diacylglycerol--serine O-phosphatidyltransferase|nr:CDP-diacylglycerol--serine O-phosphatidyltransferase [Treponema sp.]